MPASQSVPDLANRSRPITIAHRSGNNDRWLRMALAAGVDLIECDVWLHRGQIEVRHARAIGRLPLLLDRWVPVPWFRRRRLRRMLRALGPDALVLYDLKGSNAELPERLLEALAQERPDVPAYVCGRNWPVLERIAAAQEAAADPPLMLVHSVGTPDELAALEQRLATATTDALPHVRGISIRASLLTPEVVARLRPQLTLIFAWTVNDPALAQHLLALGVDGIISDNAALLVSLEHGKRAQGPGQQATGAVGHDGR